MATIFVHHLRPLLFVPSGQHGGVRGGVRSVAFPSALYDLSSGTAESRDVMDQYPDVVRRLSKFADLIRADLGDSITETKIR